LPNKTSSDWANRGESVESWGKEQGAQSKEHGAYARQATKVRKLKVFQKSMQKSPEKEWLKWLENGKWGGGGWLVEKQQRKTAYIYVLACFSEL